MMRCTRGVLWAVLFGAATLGLAAGGPLPGGEPAGASKQSHGPPPAPVAEYDAQFVAMEVPKHVLTNQVFAVKITMKNTGSKAWEGQAHAHLRSQDPPDNTTWGTHFILQGQGTNVAVGAEKVYQSQLRAPAASGEFSFQWRLVRAHDGAPFGEPTARAVVRVEKRPEAPPAALPAQDPNEKRVLTFDDFEYAGSFRPPCGTWTETGLAFRRMKDGLRRLFVNERGIREITIPPLVKFDGANFVALKTAEVKKVWGDLGIRVPKVQDVERIGPNAGFWWDEAKRTLYWTWYHGYWTGGPLPVLGASELADDGTVTARGPWTVPGMKHHWGGVTGLSKAFADQYTGGRMLAAGFGGYYSICAPCSRGPALGAISEPDSDKQTVDLVPLLAYVGGGAAPRDGDYFFGCGGFWNDPPESPTQGRWAFDDWCRSGVFIDLPDKHGYIAFVKLGTGRIGYDYGSITSGGTSHYWYFYNPRDLGDAARGRKKPNLLPHSMTKVAYPGNKGGPVSAICGACFDPDEKLLYLYKPFGFVLSRTEQPPLIHVYRVK